MLLVSAKFYGDLPMAMDAIVATVVIVDGGQLIFDTIIIIEAGRNKLFSHLIYYSRPTPSEERLTVTGAVCVHQ
jgi:hypothetical protein